ncbi:hypothetical protein TNCV_3646951 [Trichonephila clavipes]|nr:hypothetical protein TNCV_3646951 [Trichonephila clavipes]
MRWAAGEGERPANRFLFLPFAVRFGGGGRRAVGFKDRCVRSPLFHGGSTKVWVTTIDSSTGAAAELEMNNSTGRRSSEDLNIWWYLTTFGTVILKKAHKWKVLMQNAVRREEGSIPDAGDDEVHGNCAETDCRSDRQVYPLFSSQRRLNSQFVLYAGNFIISQRNEKVLFLFKLQYYKTTTLQAEDVGLPELIYGTEKKRASNPRKNIALTAKEIESSSSPNKISESHTSKMETMNEIKIKQEENLDADEEKLQQPITIIKNDIRFEDLQTFSKNTTWKYPSKHSLEILKVLDYIKVDLVPTLLELSNFASLTDDCEEDFRLKEEMEAACRFIRILQWDIGEVVVEHICRFFIGASHQFCIVKNRLLRWFDASPGGLLRGFQDSLHKETDKMTSRLLHLSLLGWKGRKICKKSGFLSPNLVDVDYTLTEFNAEPSLWEALPEQDLTFDDYVLVDTDIAVWGALSDAEIGALDHNNTESDEEESEELTPVKCY